MLEEEISRDYVRAMKARETLKASTLSFLRSQLKYVKIDLKGADLDDGRVLEVIKKQVKQRQDSIAQYEQGGRKDLADKEGQEMEILKAYLPAAMPEEALRLLVRETAAELKAAGPKDMGAVMKAVILKVAGRADNKAVSEMVKKVLSGQG